MQRPNEARVDEINAAVSATDQQADAPLQLFAGLLNEFPDPTFSAVALIRFASAIAARLPAQQRLRIARALAEEAGELGFLWH
jgi:hypothetical protein